MHRRVNSLRLCLRVLCALVAAGILLLLYAAGVESHWVQQTHHTLECPQWHGRPVRLAVLADLHARPGDGPYLDRIVRQTLALNPDAVLLLGDYMASHPGSAIGSSMGAGDIARHLAPLTAVPCFAVLGNHDHSHGAAQVQAALQGVGIRMVEGRRERLDIGGHPLDIGGIRCLFTFRTPGTIPRPEKGVPMVLLSHTPHGTTFAPRGTIVTLSGHMHGGQVCLPFFGPVFSIDKHVPLQRAAGFHTLPGNRPEYVSRGLGTSVLPIRFCCRPELLLLEIKPAPGKQL